MKDDTNPAPDNMVEAFGEAMSDAVLALPDSDGFKKARQRLLDDLWDELQYSVIDRMPEQIEWFVRDMAERTVKSMLDGRDDQVRRYLGLDGWNGRDGKHEVIHGRLFEMGALDLRKRIAQAHADLIRNERIADLEDQVASLVKQVNEKGARIEVLLDRLNESAR